MDDLEGRETSRKETYGYLTPLEFWFLGGSFIIDKKFIIPKAVEPLIRNALIGDLGSLERLLTPINLQEGGMSREQVAEERKSDNERFRRGMLGVFDPKQQIEWSAKKELELCLELPEEIQPTGTINPQWKIFITDKNNNVISDGELLRQLKLNQDFPLVGVFSFSDVLYEKTSDGQLDEARPFRFLTFNTSPSSLRS